MKNQIILFFLKNIEKYKTMFNSCLGGMIYFEKNINKFAARNPFISGYADDGYIYKFFYQKLPGCIIE